ncbi:metal-dependent hydrolase [Bythopirellula goksoeyrii]|uniref:Inner membrane protein n=1 Tax=Bythopirellula goksoeyrii TaxID=1400387 RepID=A0A5B9Q255_9BACT|nr:metal-dependent hydrolase [Bythopirellula goksoeyrii]QEG33117.1 hypothetical protein Pr1d_03780 [Bythopirellula goksoeyrii]
MAGFKTHITTSTVLGVGYGAVGAYYGLPWESSIIAGGLCGVGGMLPDIDSDTGVPFRESMCFAAAIIPVLLSTRLAELGLNHEQYVLAVMSSYVFIRFGVGKMIRKYTVHRGMFHSLPAAMTFAGLVFLFSGSDNLQLRYFKAAGLLLGVMSHLMLDEIYSVEWAGGRWRFKKSFGTAMKLWGHSTWGNLSTYAKLILVYAMILGEPMVMERYGTNYSIAVDLDRWRVRTESEMAGTPYPGTLPTAGVVPPGYAQQNQYPQAPNGETTPPDDVDRTIYDTARRFWRSMGGAK